MMIISTQESKEESFEREFSPPANQEGETTIMNDEFLIRSKFFQNPEKGCELLFQRYYANLCNHAIRFVHSREVAEDIVAEVFAIFWQNRTFEQINSSYRAYLYKSVRHRAYNYLKWDLNRTSPLNETNIQMIAPASDPYQALQYTELHQQVERIVQQLPPQCRRAYLLKRVEGKSLKEIAGELQISSKSVEALITRAMSKLRSGVKDNWLLYLIFFFFPKL